jgi:hypothetical protein
LKSTLDADGRAEYTEQAPLEEPAMFHGLRVAIIACVAFMRYSERYCEYNVSERDAMSDPRFIYHLYAAHAECWVSA